MTARRTSSIDRLLELPPVFSLADLQVAQDLTSAVARLYASRWSERGLIQRFGGGVYFNLLRDQEGPKQRVEEAVRKLVRTPVVIVGGGAITAAGWTTQIHKRLEIAVPIVRGSVTVPATEGDVILTPRYLTHFSKLLASAGDADASGLPVASPAYALADALLCQNLKYVHHRQVTLVPPDELDMDGFDEQALEDLRTALRDLGANEQDVAAMTAPYEEAVMDGPQGISF